MLKLYSTLLAFYRATKRRRIASKEESEEIELPSAASPSSDPRWEAISPSAFNIDTDV